MHVHTLARHPLKSGAPVLLERTAVDRWGVRGDRRWMVVEPSGDKVSARTDPRLLHVRVDEEPDGARFTAPGRGAVDVPLPHDGEVVVGQVWGAAAKGRLADDNGFFARLLGRDVRLLWCDDPTFRPVDQRYAEQGDTVAFADGYPLLLTTTASLTALQTWVDESCAARGEPDVNLEMTRFRPNVVVAGADAWAEQHWQRVRIGDIAFRTARLCGRCVMPNIDLETLETGTEPLRTLAARNRVDGLTVFGINLVPETAGELAVGDPVTPL